MRNKGEVTTDLEYIVSLPTRNYIGRADSLHDDEAIADAKTWALAHNAANDIDGLGLDGDPAIAGLPKFLAALMAHHLHDCDSNWHEDWRAKAVCKIIDGYMKAIRKDE